MKFIDDLIGIADLSEDSFNLLVNEFNTNSLVSFNDFSKYYKMCLDKSIEKEKADSFYDVLVYILRFLIREKSVDEGLQKFEKEMLTYHFNEVKTIWDRIKKIIPKLNEFINILKERDLLRICNRLDALKIVCDVRPLFDVERQNIIKYTYPILLSIEGEHSYEKMVFELSEVDLIIIKKEIDVAVKKIGILRKKFNDDGI